MLFRHLKISSRFFLIFYGDSKIVIHISFLDKRPSHGIIGVLFE